MKHLILLAFFFASLGCYGQGRRIQITVDKENSYYGPAYKSCVDSAYAIMNAVFNSAKFQSMYKNVKFPNSNYCDWEERDKHSPNGITGQQLYDRIFARQKPSWGIYLRMKSGGALGYTYPHTGRTTANYYTIRYDMRKLPRAYALAVNLCHEFMHERGLCHESNKFNQPDSEHPDPKGYKNDIAYRIGWDTYFILRKWVQQKRPIPGV
ncbi:hypothetical protein [Hymenobacter rigui]|uniref:Uncharacterized protein n=1 Tax=Hymenobacter rigui TaxID=334424 RepID=A0A3R9MWG0_9BACT|nr:hypothetical protein [Hymenobacter rigui]RSK50124.1 hypothetical protein EI291_05585 [Hymenobacter rigui]